jgi:acetoin utilization deacetylase AcuC-like enzyme
MEGEIKNAFCAIRPPGHHAHDNTAHYDGRGQGEGFCFFNNVAIAARYAQKVYNCKNILILDWDYHHGHALYAYPGTGSEDKHGTGDGLGYNLNVPFHGYADDSDIIDAWNNKLMPKLDELQFKPDFVFISAGFDSREDDLLGTFSFSDSCFSELTKIAMGIADTHCQGRLISTLEGGYNPEGQAQAVCAHVEALLKS